MDPVPSDKAANIDIPVWPKYKELIKKHEGPQVCMLLIPKSDYVHYEEYMQVPEGEGPRCLKGVSDPCCHVAPITNSSRKPLEFY